MRYSSQRRRAAESSARENAADRIFGDTISTCYRALPAKRCGEIPYPRAGSTDADASDVHVIVIVLAPFVRSQYPAPGATSVDNVYPPSKPNNVPGGATSPGSAISPTVTKAIAGGGGRRGT